MCVEIGGVYVNRAERTLAEHERQLDNLRKQVMCMCVEIGDVYVN
jgi:hypothetical protein